MIRSKVYPDRVTVCDKPCPAILQPTDIGEKGSLIVDGQMQLESHQRLCGGHFCCVDSPGWGYVQPHRCHLQQTQSLDQEQKKRGMKAAIVRQEIQDRNVPLPQKWDNFIAHAQDKVDLARFLSQQLVVQAPSNKIIGVTTGFSNKEHVGSSTSLACQHRGAEGLAQRSRHSNSAPLCHEPSI